MSTIPQTTLNSLINSYKGKDYVLWQILTALAQSNQTLTNEFNTLLTGNNWFLRIGVALSESTDIVPWWVTVYLPRDSSNNLVYPSVNLQFVCISFKPALTGTFTGDVKYSRDQGNTWNSVFKSGLSVPAGNESYIQGNLALGTFYDGDIIRLDCSAEGGATGVEVALIGSYNGG